MARDEDFTNLYDFGTMTDDEVYDVVVQHLREYPELDAGWIDVRVRDGNVTLEGRVGSDGEVAVAEKVLVEVLGLESVTNNLVVGEAHRGLAPEAADDAAAARDEAGGRLGGSLEQQSDTADHLVQDLEAESYGTQDMGEAIEDGTVYSPPERPTPDGYGSREAH